MTRIVQSRTSLRDGLDGNAGRQQSCDAWQAVVTRRLDSLVVLIVTPSVLLTILIVLIANFVWKVSITDCLRHRHQIVTLTIVPIWITRSIAMYVICLRLRTLNRFVSVGSSRDGTQISSRDPAPSAATEASRPPCLCHAAMSPFTRRKHTAAGTVLTSTGTSRSTRTSLRRGMLVKLHAKRRSATVSSVARRLSGHRMS